MTTPIPNAADMADKPIDYLLMCGRSENPKPPSAIDVIKMFREIHEEHRDDASARGLISSKAAMAFVEYCESLEEQNRNMRKALRYYAQESNQNEDGLYVLSHDGWFDGTEHDGSEYIVPFDNGTTAQKALSSLLP